MRGSYDTKSTDSDHLLFTPRVNNQMTEPDRLLARLKTAAIVDIRWKDQIVVHAAFRCFVK